MRQIQHRDLILATSTVVALGVLAVSSGCTVSDTVVAPSRTSPPQSVTMIVSSDLALVRYETKMPTKNLTSQTVLISAAHGGSLNLGKAVLEIPAAALSVDTYISIIQASGTFSEYQIEPTGLHFAIPATLTVKYDDTSADPTSTNYTPGAGGATALAWFDPSASLWTPMPSTDDASTMAVTLKLDHLSYYALAK